MPAAAHAAALLALLFAPALAAQAPLGGNVGWQAAPTFEYWRFDCCTEASANASVKWASEWTVPITAVVTYGSAVTVDVYTAWSSSQVALRDASVPTLHLSGPTDTRLRMAVRFAGDALLATVGLNVPTGATELDLEQVAVQRVVGAPTLQFQTQALGTGLGGTAGLVYTRQLGGWSWGLGASYEYRDHYSPAQAEALGLGAGSVSLRPGQAIRLSLGTDGLVGQSAMALSVASTFYTRDRLAVSGGATPPDPVTLGPMFTGEWRLRAAGGAFRELTFYAFDRYRLAYSRGGSSVPGTSGNLVEAGVRGLIPMSPSVAFVAGVHGRHLTGLSVDNSLATAATVAGGGDVGVEWTMSRVALRPVVGAELGRLDTGGARLTARKLYTSLSITSR